MTEGWSTDSNDLVRRVRDTTLPTTERLEAFGQLLARHERRVRRVVRLRLGADLRSALESGDIVQETFLRALRAFERFEPRSKASLVSWLARIAERAILAEVDRQRAAKRNAPREPLVDLAAADAGPGTEVSARERARIVEECVLELPEAQREVVILRTYLGASWEEVAAEMGKPSPDAARMLHAKALVALDRLLRRRGIRDR